MEKSNTKWSQSNTIYDNTQKGVIHINPDTLDNKLRDFEEGVENKRELRHFIELSLALLGVLLTSNFKDFLGVPSSYWFAIFFLALIWSTGNFCWDLFKFRQKYLSRKDILNDLTDFKRAKFK